MPRTVKSSQGSERESLKCQDSESKVRERDERVEAVNIIDIDRKAQSTRTVTHNFLWLLGNLRKPLTRQF